MKGVRGFQKGHGGLGSPESYKKRAPKIREGLLRFFKDKPHQTEEDKKEYAKKYYQKNKHKWVKYDIENRDKINERRRKSNQIKYRNDPVFAARQRKTGRDGYRRDSKLLKEFLGGKCIRCGFTDFRALQVDHVNGGGSKELRDKKTSGLSRSPKLYLKRIKENPSRYQLLCANCNWIKRHENNENRKPMISL